MRGSAKKRRRRRTLAVMLLAVVVVSYWPCRAWMKSVAESRISDLAGGFLDVKLGGVSGGVLTGLTFSDLKAYPFGTDTGKALVIERLELPLRLWQLRPDSLLSFSGPVSVHFSEEGEFIRGHVYLSAFEGRGVVVHGNVAPVIASVPDKRPVKALFERKGDLYAYRLRYDERPFVTGTLDPAERLLQLSYEGAVAKGGQLKAEIGSRSPGKVEAYVRMDKLMLGAKQLIGDLWLDLELGEETLYSLRADNLLVERRPVWPFRSGGSYDPARALLLIDEMEWGDNVTAKGEVSLAATGDLVLEVRADALKLEELMQMFPPSREKFRGALNIEARVKGPLPGPAVTGRITCGEGAFGELKFDSFFVTVTGDWPVLWIDEGRIAQGPGALLVEGSLDVSRLGAGGDGHEGLRVYTDHRLAFWRDWQISKWEDTGMVEARHRNLTFSTHFDDENRRYKPLKKADEHRELSFKYKLDQFNSIRMEFEGDRDFMGIERRMEF